MYEFEYRKPTSIPEAVQALGADMDAKALAGGLLAEGDEAPDEQVTDLIFAPGFSTADTLTELAGRGVGMDVVRSEAQALGGRVAVASETGQGARFTITLPLTSVP